MPNRSSRFSSVSQRQLTAIKMLVMLAIYLGLTYFAGDYGRILLYPIRMLVTFLHEFGHAAGALLTGGNVANVEVRADGSGVTWTSGGNRTIILMGGYIGSAIFGNLLFYIGAKGSERWAEIATYVLAAIMLITGIVWYSSIFTTLLLLLFAGLLVLIARKTTYDAPMLMFLGLASILYIIQDFNVGPSSDLSAYADQLIILPATAWMYIWLAIVVVLFVYNVRQVFKSP